MKTDKAKLKYGLLRVNVALKDVIEAIEKEKAKGLRQNKTTGTNPTEIKINTNSGPKNY